MRYLGGKSILVKKFIHILDKSLEGKDKFIEPFVGGFNIVPTLSNPDNKPILCSDNHVGVINLYNQMLIDDSFLPDTVSYEEYMALKKIRGKDPLSTFISFACAFAANEWQGYARGIGRNFANEGKRSIIKKFSKINKDNINFKHLSYQDIDASNTTIYCDPPYNNVTSYKTGKFDSDAFYQWCDAMKQKNNDVFVSEFNAPSHWDCVWSIERKITSTRGEYQTKTDRLFKV